MNNATTTNNITTLTHTSIDQDSTASFWWVWIKNFDQVVIPDDQVTADVIEDLETLGWTLVWDSAKSEQFGKHYAIEHYGATYCYSWIPNAKKIIADHEAWQAMWA